MPNRNIAITDQANQMLEDLYRRRKKTHKAHTTYGGLVSEAIKLLAMQEEQTAAEELFERIIAQRLERFENRIAGFIASVGIDVDMILHEILEQRAALKENAGKPPTQVYQELRQYGVALHKSKKSFPEVRI